MYFTRLKSHLPCRNYLFSKALNLKNYLYCVQKYSKSSRNTIIRRIKTAPTSIQSIQYDLHCNTQLLGTPLLSNVNIRFRTPIPNNFNPESRRYISIESVSDRQNTWFSFLSESTPVKYAQNCFEYIHDMSGLPWWASIILTTVVVRTSVAFPLALYQNYILAKVQNLQHEMRDISKELGKEIAIAIRKFHWSEGEAKIHYRYSLKKQWNKLVVRDNCHPFKASLPIWFQLPMWVCLSVSLRNMAYMLPRHDIDSEVLFLQLSCGGCLWFPNLIEVDHSWILPVSLGILNLAVVELQSMTKIKEPTKFNKYLTNFFRIISIAMVPVAASVPTCMSIYWVSSSACGLAQNLLVLSPRIKKLACIPKVKPIVNGTDVKTGSLSASNTIKRSPPSLEEQEFFQNHPYRHIAAQVQARIDHLTAKIGLR